MHISIILIVLETIEAAEAVIKATQLDQAFLLIVDAKRPKGLKLARKYYYEKHGKG